MIGILKIENPYPEDIFSEPTHEEWYKFHQAIEGSGLVQDKFFGAYGRKVWNNCVEKIEKNPDIIIVDKALLMTMMREFWVTDNNPICEEVTILFLRKIGLTDRQITQKWMDIQDIKNRNFSDAQEHLNESFKDTMDYYYNED